MMRNQQILALRDLYSYSLIAEMLGVTRNVVAGVCFRADWDQTEMTCSPGARAPNKCGLGHHGGGKWPAHHKKNQVAA